MFSHKRENYLWNNSAFLMRLLQTFKWALFYILTFVSIKILEQGKSWVILQLSSLFKGHWCGQEAKESASLHSETKYWCLKILVFPRLRAGEQKRIKPLKPGAAWFPFPHHVPFFSSGLCSSAFMPLLLSRNSLQVSQSYLNHHHHQTVLQKLLSQVIGQPAGGSDHYLPFQQRDGHSSSMSTA